MNTDFHDLKRRMATLPADELLDLVAFDVADYKVEALDLARDELYKRGYSDSDLENWRVSAAARRSNADLGHARVRFALTLVLTAIVTFCLFAPLIYYSIIAYGIPCAVFIAAGYLVWLALPRSDPQQARAFAIGFACGVSFLLLVVAMAVPWYGGMILAECLGLWILILAIRKVVELFNA
jgi:hypothetical protein